MTEPGPNSPSASAIEPAGDARRRAALRQQQDELLRKIRHKQRAVAKLERARERAETWFLEQVEPLHEECQRVNDEVLAAFDALLEGGLSKRARRAVRDVMRALARHEILWPRQESFAAEWEREPESDPQPAPSAVADEGELRLRFRRVALALHPDRVQEESEKQRLTEVMKDVTRAYQDRDLAGLLQIERTLVAGASPVEAPAVALETLVRVVTELEEQLVALRRASKALKQNPLLRVFLESEEQPRRRGPSGLDRLLASAREELEELNRIRDVVIDFKEKRITLEQFLAGPAFRFGGAEFDLEDLLNSLMDEPLEPRTRRRSRRGRER